MKKLGCILLLLISNFLVAQIKYEKGYFIDNTGQKTECLIKNIDWRANPTKFNFKLNEEGQEKENSINYVKEFSINQGNKYERHEVLVDTSAVDLEKLTENRNPEWKKTTVFLKVLVDGNPKLYDFVDGNMRRFFYSTQNIGVEQLVYKEYLKAGDIVLLKNKYYQQQLWNNVKCKDATSGKISRVDYKTDDLIKYFKTVNNCNGNKISDNLPSEKKKRKAFNYKLKGGLNYSSLRAKDLNIPDNEKVNFEKKTTYRLAGEIECVLPFNNNIFSVYVEPSYQTDYKSDIKAYYQYLPGKYHTYNLSSTYNSFDLAIAGRYNQFISKNSKIYFNIGLVQNFVLKEDFSIDEKNYIRFISSTSMIYGIGFNYKKFIIEGRLNNTGNISNSSRKVQFNSAGIMIGYTIF